MNRRNMLAALVAAGMKSEAQTSTTSSESLYIPKPQLVEDRKFLHDFMDEFSFVDLVTAAWIDLDFPQPKASDDLQEWLGTKVERRAAYRI